VKGDLSAPLLADERVGGDRNGPMGSAAQSASGSFLLADAVTKTYARGGREVHALEDINLGIDAGSFVTIVGRSGCGKSTLLRLLAGLISPTSGRVCLEGNEVTGAPAAARCVFQDYVQSLLPWKTIDENVRFGVQHACEPQMLSRQQELTAAREALALVGLSHAVGRFPWELSGGMQQRVAIARALASQPRLLLMDEPFSSVDALSRANLHDTLLTAWTKFGNTIVFITHDIDEAVYLSDRVIVLNDGGKGVLADIPIEAARPRDPLATREEPAFLRARREIFRLVMS
jgi:NitT/TauT family transport system ATP-binding protein